MPSDQAAIVKEAKSELKDAPPLVADKEPSWELAVRKFQDADGNSLYFISNGGDQALQRRMTVYCRNKLGIEPETAQAVEVDAEGNMGKPHGPAFGMLLVGATDVEIAKLKVKFAPDFAKLADSDHTEIDLGEEWSEVKSAPKNEQAEENGTKSAPAEAKSDAGSQEKQTPGNTTANESDGNVPAIDNAKDVSEQIHALGQIGRIEELPPREGEQGFRILAQGDYADIENTVTGWLAQHEFDLTDESPSHIDIYAKEGVRDELISSLYDKYGTKSQGSNVLDKTAQEELTAPDLLEDKEPESQDKLEAPENPDYFDPIGHYESDLNYLQAKIAAEPDNIELYKARESTAETYLFNHGNEMSADEFNKIAQGAIADTNEWIRLSPDDLEAHFQRGSWQLATGNYAESLPDFNKFISEGNPQELGYLYLAEAHNRRANAYKEMGEEELSLKDLKQAEELREKDYALREKGNKLGL